jgi:hypothetical protein
MAWEPTEIAKALRLTAQPNGGKSLRHSMGDQSAEAASVGMRSRLALTSPFTGPTREHWEDSGPPCWWDQLCPVIIPDAYPEHGKLMLE